VRLIFPATRSGGRRLGLGWLVADEAESTRCSAISVGRGHEPIVREHMGSIERHSAGRQIRGNDIKIEPERGDVS